MKVDDSYVAELPESYRALIDISVLLSFTFTLVLVNPDYIAYNEAERNDIDACDRQIRSILTNNNFDITSDQSADFLFNPDNNIQLGTGYLKLLISTTFKKVEDSRCRILCAIAAYNTGTRNVSRAINGTTNLSKAIPTINTMSYDQLFEHLKIALPHDETKDYIRKVTTRMQKYIK